MNESKTLLEVRGVSKTYFNKKGYELKRALRPTSFDLYRGAVFGLLGVNKKSWTVCNKEVI